jgi:hypothetical protein
METYARRESTLKLWETLMRSEAQRLAGSPGRSVEEVAEMMRQAAKEAADGKRA